MSIRNYLPATQTALVSLFLRRSLSLIVFSVSIAVSFGCYRSPAVGGALVGADNQNSSGSADSRQVRIKTVDKWTIVGDLSTPKGNPKGVVVLLHQRAGSAADWQPLVTALGAAGFAVLAIDQRGAGRSTGGPGPVGDDAPWDTSGDIAAVISSLGARGPVALAGASYGANNALIYAAAHSRQIAAVALFSPGADYHGLDALTAARAYRGPLTIYHFRGDRIAGNGPQRIAAVSPSKDRNLRVYDGDGHGTALLVTGAKEDAVHFFLRVFKRYPADSYRGVGDAL